MNFFAFSSLLTAVIPLFLSLIIISFGRSKIHRVWALCALAISIWGFGTYLVAVANNPKSALFGWRVAFSGALYISVFFYHTVCIFGNLSRKKTLFLVYTQAIFFHVLSITTDKVFTNWHVVFNSLYYNTATPAYFLTAFAWLIVVLLGHYELWKIYKKSSGFKRIQTLYLLVGFFTGFVGGFLCLLPAIGINLYPFTSVSGALYALIVTYAIFKYRLMDINIALTRVGIFVFIYTLVLGIPFWLAYKYSLWEYSIWAMLFLATSGPFAYVYFRRRAENFILKEQRRYHEILKNLSKSMISIRDLEKLLETVTSTTQEAVKASFCLVYLKDDKYQSFRLRSCAPQKDKLSFLEFIPLESSLIKKLNKEQRPFLGEEISSQDNLNLNFGLAIPCFGKDGLLGMIILGVKPNNQMYTLDDALVFENLANQTSLAIENCTYWKEIDDRQRKARLQEMDTFSYSLAHEIDNPMTIVFNLAKFLKGHFLKYITDPEEAKEVEEACDYMVEGSSRVMTMVKAIRQFGQKVTGEMETLNLQEVTEGFIRLYMPEMKANFVFFEKEITSEPIYVKGVAAELQQVLMIFAKNAIHAMKYSQEKKIILKISKVNSSVVRVSLSDTGYGIKKENLETIFAPFFTSKASTEGTGMGLHNAKGFIIRHRGTIWAESQGDGKGATFIFELPIIEEIVPEDSKKKDGKRWAY